MPYKAILVAADGDWVIDYEDSPTIEDVEQRLADQGSRWYFYPFHGVIRDNGRLATGTQRLVSCAWPFEEMQGKTIRTFTRVIAEISEENLRDIIEH